MSNNQSHRFELLMKTDDGFPVIPGAKVLIDGEECQQDSVIVYHDVINPARHKFVVQIISDEVSRQVIQFSASDFTPNISIVNATIWSDDLFVTVEFPITSLQRVAVAIDMLAQVWSEDVNIARYVLVAASLAEDYGLDARMVEERFTLQFQAGDKLPSVDGTLWEIASPAIEALHALHSGVMKRLDDIEFSGKVVVAFDFPLQIKTACEQYLLYFAEFLKDVGVGATTDLSHEAGQVLFTVTPENPRQALDKIREALAAFLCLPGSPAGGAIMPSPDTPMEVQRLGITIQHLQTQITFANMMMQTQQATILAQQTAIGALQQVQPQQPITPEVFIESVRVISATAKGGDSEKFLGGTVELTKYEGKGFNVNLAQVFRHLRDYFTGDPGNPE